MTGNVSQSNTGEIVWLSPLCVYRFGKIFHKLWNPSCVNINYFPILLEFPLTCRIIWMTGNNSPHAFMYPSASPCKLNPPRSKHHAINLMLQGNVYHMRYVFSPCRQQPLAYQEGAHDYFLVLSTCMYCFDYSKCRRHNPGLYALSNWSGSGGV